MQSCDVIIETENKKRATKLDSGGYGATHERAKPPESLGSSIGCRYGP